MLDGTVILAAKRWEFLLALELKLWFLTYIGKVECSWNPIIPGYIIFGNFIYNFGRTF
jgi:hypothetical protein